MELPNSIAALGEQLRGASEIVPDPALFHDTEVFAAERARGMSWETIERATPPAREAIAASPG